MKKLLILTVFVFAAFMLAGCGGSSSSSSEDLKSMYKDIWEEGTRIVDEDDADYYLVWKGTKDGLGKIIYEYDKETKKEIPAFGVYSDWEGVYYSLVSEKEEGYIKVIDFYRNEWNICDNIKGSLEESNYKDGYCIVKAQRETETAYYLYDMYSGFICEYSPDLKMKIIIRKNPKIISQILRIIFTIKKKQN